MDTYKYNLPTNAHKVLNKHFGNLYVVAFSHINRHKEDVYVCECSCGNYTKVTRYKLLNGNTKSCGCLKVKNIDKQREKYQKEKREK